MDTAATVLLYAALAGFVIWRVVGRQLRGFTLTVRGLTLVPMILIALGVFSSAQSLPKASVTEIVLVGVDLVLLGALGALRASTVAVGERNGYAFAKGSNATLILWLVTVGIRIGFLVLGTQLHAVSEFTSASIALSMGLTLAIQNAITYNKARQLGLRVANNRAELATAQV